MAARPTTRLATRPTTRPAASPAAQAPSKIPPFLRPLASGIDARKKSIRRVDGSNGFERQVSEYERQWEAMEAEQDVLRWMDVAEERARGCEQRPIFEKRVCACAPIVL